MQRLLEHNPPLGQSLLLDCHERKRFYHAPFTIYSKATELADHKMNLQNCEKIMYIYIHTYIYYTDIYTVYTHMYILYMWCFLYKNMLPLVFYCSNEKMISTMHFKYIIQVLQVFHVVRHLGKPQVSHSHRCGHSPSHCSISLPFCLPRSTEFQSM